MQTLLEWIPVEYLLVAAAVLAVLFVATLLFRAMAGRGGGNESSRLGVSEYLDIDKQRRVVLLRRDDVEHLVLIGGGQDVVVESAIRPGVRRRDDVPASPRVIPGDRLDSAHEPGAPEPPVKGAVGDMGAARPVPLRPTRPPVFGDHAPARDPEAAERAEPRLEPLKGGERSREA